MLLINWCIQMLTDWDSYFSHLSSYNIKIKEEQPLNWILCFSVMLKITQTRILKCGFSTNVRPLFYSRQLVDCWEPISVTLRWHRRCVCDKRLITASADEDWCAGQMTQKHGEMRCTQTFSCTSPVSQLLYLTETWFNQFALMPRNRWAFSPLQLTR